MDTWLEKLRKIDERSKEQGKIAREMTHRPQADIESLRGQDPMTDWALGMRERTLSPLSTLAGEAKRFQGLSPQEMGMELVGGGMAGIIGKVAGKAAQKTEFELAHELAQKNAALPIEQGGLGLPPNNTAMDRAKAMGFDTPAYHGTNYDLEDIDRFRSGYIGENFKESQGGFHFASNPETASTYGKNILEARIIKPSNLIDLKVGHPNFETYQHSPSSFYDWNSSNLTDMVDNGGLAISKGDEVQYILNQPSNIRSRFAAFDPFQRNSANILAGTALGGIGLSTLAGNQDEYY